jgi:N-acetylglucosamine kinase
MHVLGIDAGGTKTVCLLANDEGEVLAEARGGGANLQSAGELEVEKVLHHVMDIVLAAHDVVPAAICLGIAGVDRPEDADAVRGIMRRIGFKARTLIVNDALIALVAGAGNQAGVVVVAGTGSIAYGKDTAGRAARAGGWGYVLGDEGGGFWIGRLGLSAVVREFDGRGPATRLTELILAQLRLASPTQLIREVYDTTIPRHAIAGLAPLVQRAADQGDAVAADILKRAGAELASAATSVIVRLDMRGEAFPTVLAGGVFRGLPSLAADLTKRLADVAPLSDVRRLQVEPAVGAIRLAIAAVHGEAVIPTYV